jgi:hypothetical protein
MMMLLNPSESFTTISNQVLTYETFKLKDPAQAFRTQEACEQFPPPIWPSSGAIDIAAGFNIWRCHPVA